MKALQISFLFLTVMSISILNAQSPAISRVVSAPETDETELFIMQFHQTLNQVVNDYPNNFKNIITGPVSEEESDHFNVSAELPEALYASVSTRMSSDLSSVQYVYTAKFIEGDEETAKTFFDAVEYLVMSCPFECCEIAYDNLEGGWGIDEKSTIWMSIDDDNPNFEQLLIQLRIYKQIASADKEWVVILNISPVY